MIRTFTLFLFLITCFNFSRSQDLLFLTGPDSVNMLSSDRQLLDTLESMGLNVMVRGVDANPIQPEEADGKTFAFISPSVTASLIGIAFRDVKIPIIVSEAFLFDDMKMTGPTAGVDYGIRSGRDQIDILEPDHPIAGVYNNTITVTSSLTSFMWGNPSADALKVAEISNSGSNNQVAIFVYDYKDEMVNYRAPAMRIGYYLRENATTLSSDIGWDVFRNTINFVLSEYCISSADSLSLASDTLNIINGEANLAITIEDTAYVAAGYSKKYFLTSEPSGIILETSDSLNFEVNSGGDYGIYSMVYLGMPGTYDYFDDSFIIIGQTSIAEIEDAIQMQGVCADIDTSGIQFFVQDCGANAGALDIPSASSLNGGQATLTTTHTIPPSVPPGYDVKYLLSRGSSALYVDISNTPEFTVTEAAEYGIHTLVYDSVPGGVNFLDLSFYQIGTAKIGDIAAQITAERLCADLDFAGAIVDIDSCKADAGVLAMALETDSLRTGPIDIQANILASPTVPSGFNFRYILTSGDSMIVEAIGNTPIFTVNSSARYRIHSLVYNPDPNSPDFVDLSNINLGQDSLNKITDQLDTASICADISSPVSPTNVVSAVFFIKFDLSEKPGPRNVLLWILSEAVRDGVYSVERSIDGILYNVIYTRKELTSARNPVTYVYVDVEPRPGKNYYRIKFTNINNTFFYSRVILVENEVTITPEFRIFPNPTFGEVNFEPQFLNPGKFEVNILDSRGASVYKAVMDFTEEPIKTLDISYLPRGLYHVNFLDVSSGERSSYNLFRQQER